MQQINRSSLVITIIVISSLVLASCAFLTPDIPETPIPQATNVPNTITPRPTYVPNTVTPHVTDLPNTSTPSSGEFTRTNNFGDGYVAHILIEDVSQMKEEDILRLLVMQWLDHCKTEEMDTDAVIEDFTIDNIRPLEVHGYYNEPIFKATVDFSIITKQDPPYAWGSMMIKPDGPWLRLSTTLGVFGNKNESPYYWLGGAGAAG